MHLRVYTHDRSHSASLTHVAYTIDTVQNLDEQPKRGCCYVREKSWTVSFIYSRRAKGSTHTELTRKRKIDWNPPPKGKRRARGEGSSEPKIVSPRQRLNEFPNECLAVYGKEGSKLFCNACREELSLRRNIVLNHVASRKHKCSQEKLA